MWLLVALTQIAPPALPPCDAWAELAITDVQLINVVTGAIEPNATITIANGRICSIAARAQSQVPAGTPTIDGRGRYAIPAFWDLYAPPTHAPALRRLVGFGIANVFSTSAAPEEIVDWQRVLNDPQNAAPTIYTTIELAADRSQARFRLDPGADLHEALALLVQRGVSAIDALRAATLAPASAAGVADRVGILAAGYEASLLLLEGNPLEDIGQTRSVSLMLLRGETIGLRQLARLRLAR